jgi:SAM-dependent methyltransferase
MIHQHDLNRRRWDELTPVHVHSAFYDAPGFLAGRSAMDAIERDGVGEVRGKSLLHLQCHFGLTTLDFARQGAQVVGVDFSKASIEQARQLADQADLAQRSRFVCCDVLELDQHLHEKFDVVFTSYGVLTWLCDLQRWGQIVARFLKPGGKFYIAEIHPLAFVFREDADQFDVAYDYFNCPEGLEIPPGPDYANPEFIPDHGERYWAWSLADIFSALQLAGLHIRDFREYPFSCYRQFPFLVQQSDGWWHWPPDRRQLPLLFSLAAFKS